MLLLHVRFAKEDAAKRGLTLTVAELADTLRRLGYAVKLRTALGGGPGGACLRSLRHSFLTVSVSSPSGSMSYVLDPRFRDQVGPLPLPASCLPVCSSSVHSLRCVLGGRLGSKHLFSKLALAAKSVT